VQNADDGNGAAQLLSKQLTTFAALHKALNSAGLQTADAGARNSAPAAHGIPQCMQQSVTTPPH
jgi:hypothetical protein